MADVLKTDASAERSAKPSAKQRSSRTLVKFANHEAQQDETRRYWLGKTIAEKMEETASLIRYAYGLQGIDVDAQRPERTVVRIQRPQR